MTDITILDPTSEVDKVAHNSGVIAIVDAIAFTRITAKGCDLRKEYTLNPDGTISKSALANVSQGTATTEYASDLLGLGALLDKFKKNEVLATGIFEKKSVTLTTAGREKPELNLYSRSQEFMKQPSTSDYIQLLDNDPHKDGVTFDTAEDFANYFYSLHDNFKGLELLVRQSSSAGIYNKSTGEMLSNKLGWHGFLRVAPEVKQSDLGDYINKLCWLRGDGYIALAINGAKLERTTFDMAVFSQERMIYEAKPKLNGDLKRKINKQCHKEGRAFTLSDFVVLDSIDVLVAQAKADIEDEAVEVKKAYDAVKVKELVDKGVSKSRAIKTVERLSEKTLTTDTLVTLSRGSEALTVRELCENPNFYNNKSMADPIEGVAYGKTTAKFYWNNGNPKISSMAHGGVVYRIAKPETMPQAKKREIVPVNMRVNTEDFPHATLNEKTGIVKVPMTFEAVKYLAEVYGFEIKRNLVTKSDEILLPSECFNRNTHSNDVGLNVLKSTATLNGLQTGAITEMVSVVSSLNQYNPVLEWIASSPWDGISRIDAMLNCVEVEAGWEERRKTYFTRWMYAAVGLLSNKGDLSTRGILTFTGAQNLGKTHFLAGLTGEMFKYCIDAFMLDPDSKDSVSLFASHWIVELGELDATFKKADISALKGFVTRKKDKLRFPYDRYATEMPRSTVVIASVNDREFLADTTGNSRFWVLPINSFNFDVLRQINKQQLWAEVATKLEFELERDPNNLPWFLNEEENKQLDISNMEFEIPCELTAMVLQVVKSASEVDPTKDNSISMSATEMCRYLGVKEGLSQTRIVGKVLREKLGYEVKKGTRTYVLYGIVAKPYKSVNVSYKR